MLGTFGLCVFLMIAYQCAGFTKCVYVNTTGEATSLIRERYKTDYARIQSRCEGFFVKGSDDVCYCFLDSYGSDKKHGQYFLYYKTMSDTKASDVCSIRMALTGPF